MYGLKFIESQQRFSEGGLSQPWSSRGLLFCGLLRRICVGQIYGVSMRERIIPYRGSLGWLRVDMERTYFSDVLMYRQCFKPSYLADFFRRYQSRGPVQGEREDQAIPIVRTITWLSSFQIKGVHLWNFLTSSLRDLPSIPSFKGTLNRFLRKLDEQFMLSCLTDETHEK